MYIRMSCPLAQGCQCASLINPGNGIIDDLAALVIPRSLSVQTLSASSFWMIERGTSSLLVWGGQHHAPKRLTCEIRKCFFLSAKEWPWIIESICLASKKPVTRIVNHWQLLVARDGIIQIVVSGMAYSITLEAVPLAIVGDELLRSQSSWNPSAYTTCQFQWIFLVPTCPCSSCSANQASPGPGAQLKSTFP